MHRDCAGFGTDAARDLSVDEVREVFSRCGVRPRGFVNEAASGQDFVMAHFLQSRSKMELLLDKADENAAIARQEVASPATQILRALEAVQLEPHVVDDEPPTVRVFSEVDPAYLVRGDVVI